MQASGTGVFRQLYVHDNTSTAASVSFLGSNMVSLTYSVIANNGGIGVDPTNTGSFDAITNNVIYNNGGDGIQTGTGMETAIMNNNIISKNTGFGLSSATAGWAAQRAFDGNAYCVGANTTNLKGPRNNVDDQITSAVNGIFPYVTNLDVLVGADPFTNAAAADWSLNNSNPGAAQVRGAGQPKTLPGLSTAGHIDMGVFQTQSAGGNYSFVQ